MNVLFETGESGATATTHDWLTPPEILNALGEFDLDPCASEFQPWRTARQQFTIKDDGMAREWQGRVWCNPPYGPFAARWLERCAAHGNAIALVFARTETAVFQDHAFEKADAMLFLRGRLSFRLPGGGACWKRRRSVRTDCIRQGQCRHPRRLRADGGVCAPWWRSSMTEAVKRVLDPCCGSLKLTVDLAAIEAFNRGAHGSH